jgi:pimeloyl-ACP methyl ester carboxylesterase
VPEGRESGAQHRVRHGAHRRALPRLASLLAGDALALLRAVWPGHARLHVFGVSMGGMVAQRLALALLAAQQERADTPPAAESDVDDAASPPQLPPPPRLASLTLSVTARAYGLARFLPPLPPRLLHAALAPLLARASASAVVAWLLPRCFPPDVLAAPHAAERGATVGALWRRRWTDEYAQWFCFHDAAACAEQASVALRHHLRDADAAALRDSGVPILLKLAARDRLIPPRAQRALAAALRARVHESAAGHMGDAEDNAAFIAAMARHFCDAP